jgi:hypothetical protein
MRRWRGSRSRVAPVSARRLLLRWRSRLRSARRACAWGGRIVVAPRAGVGPRPHVGRGLCVVLWGQASPPDPLSRWGTLSPNGSFAPRSPSAEARGNTWRKCTLRGKRWLALRGTLALVLLLRRGEGGRRPDEAPGREYRGEPEVTTYFTAPIGAGDANRWERA